MPLSPDTIDRWSEENHLYRYERMLLEKLTEGPATRAELIDHLYADREDGGPRTAEKCIDQYLFQLRHKLGGRIAVRKETTYVLEIYPERRDL